MAESKIKLKKIKVKKVLIAEDEKAYCKALDLKLKNAGFDVHCVSDGEEAMKIIKEGNFDLLLCDLIMPKINGFTVLEEIKNQGIKLPTIIISNLSQVDDKKKVDALGAIDFLIKSNVTISEVINKVEHFLKDK